MSDVLSSYATPQTEAEYEEAIAEMLAEMNRINAQIRQGQADIDGLKLETAAYNAERETFKAESETLKVEREKYKAESEKYKAETERLQEEGRLVANETRAALDRLRMMF